MYTFYANPSDCRLNTHNACMTCTEGTLGAHTACIVCPSHHILTAGTVFEIIFAEYKLGTNPKYERDPSKNIATQGCQNTLLVQEVHGAHYLL